MKAFQAGIVTGNGLRSLQSICELQKILVVQPKNAWLEPVKFEKETCLI